MKLTFDIIALLLHLPRIISVGSRRSTILLEHPDVVCQLTFRRFSKGEQSNPSYPGKNLITNEQPSTGKTFLQEGDKLRIRTICHKLFRADIFEHVEEQIKYIPFKFCRFLGGDIKFFKLNEKLKAEKLKYTFQGLEYEVDVIQCPEKGKKLVSVENGLGEKVWHNERKVLFFENGTNENDFYTFEIDKENPGNAPIIRWAIKCADIKWNMKTLMHDVEQNRLPNSLKSLEEFLKQEEEFKHNITSTREEERKHICEVKGFNLFELCSCALSVWSKRFINSRNLVNQIIQVEDACIPEADVKILSEENNLLGMTSFCKVEVVGCYSGYGSQSIRNPKFYIAADQQVSGGAFILENSKDGKYLVVKMRIKNVPVLKNIL